VFRKSTFLLVRNADVQIKLSLDRLHDIEHGNISGLFGERETAFDTPIGPYDPCLNQLLKYFGQKTARDLVFFGDFVHITDLFERLAGQIQNTPYPVIPFSCDLHIINYIKPYDLVKVYSGVAT